MCEWRDGRAYPPGKFEGEWARGMRVIFRILLWLVSLSLSAAAQDTTPAPSSSPAVSDTSASMSAVASPTPASTPLASPDITPVPAPMASPTPSLLKKIGVKIQFIPPPMEGTISLGIYDDSGKLVRVLHKAATADEFVAALDGFITHWDGLDDAGKPLPPGHYNARGYMVGAVTARPVDLDSLIGTGTAAALTASPAPGATPQYATKHVMWFKFPNGKSFVSQAKIRVGLVGNPLDRDRAGSADLCVGLDANGRSWLQLTDGLPLKQIGTTQGLAWDMIGRSAPGEPLIVFQSIGELSIEAFAITKVSDMMAFDCGGFDFAGVGKW